MSGANPLDLKDSCRLGAGLFGGEGFIMQKLDGDGLVFVHAGGTLMKRDLQPGERLHVDTGCIVAFEPSVDFDIQYVGKLKSALFSGEGLFFATLTGPGRVWLQSLPLSRLANRIIASAPAAGGRQVGEGSVLGSRGRNNDGRKVRYGKHAHETFSIGIVTNGRCIYLNGKTRQRIGAGTVVLMNPGYAHACNPDRGGLARHWHS
jgi:hypothetical protein